VPSGSLLALLLPYDFVPPGFKGAG
jgi:hypothetical protein